MSPYLREAHAVLNEQHAKKYKNWQYKVLTINEGLQLETAKVNQAVVNNIHEALWDEKAIIAKYQSGQKIPSTYKIQPAGLVYRGRIIYLICSFDDNPEKIIYLPLQSSDLLRFFKKRQVFTRGKSI